MKVIHKIMRIKKLSTLKRSWKFDDFALKHSCFCAETLLRYIYTYNHLYKTTCSYLPRLVDKCFFKIIPLLSITVLSACSCPNREQSILWVGHREFQQFEGSNLHPAEYFTCGGKGNPCRQYSQLKVADSKNLENFNLSKGESSHGSID